MSNKLDGGPGYPTNMRQAAINLTNCTPEASKLVDSYVASHGGSIEHLPYSQVEREMTSLLRKNSDAKRRNSHG